MDKNLKISELEKRSEQILENLDDKIEKREELLKEIDEKYKYQEEIVSSIIGLFSPIYKKYKEKNLLFVDKENKSTFDRGPILYIDKDIYPNKIYYLDVDTNSIRVANIINGNTEEIKNDFVKKRTLIKSIGIKPIIESLEVNTKLVDTNIKELEELLNDEKSNTIDIIDRI